VGWAIGSEEVRRLVPGLPTMVVTDLAVPSFTLALGAAAHVVGLRLRRRRGSGALAVGRRWIVVAACGLALGLAFDGRIDRISILEILALCGATVTVAAFLLRPGRWGWLSFAVLATALAGPISTAAGASESGWWFRLAGDKFPVVTYLALAAWGAAVASLLRRGERVGSVARLALLAALATAVVALAGGWPPRRYPGDATFILLGVAASLALWALLASPAFARSVGGVARGLEVAGRRSLIVFVGHYAIRFALDGAGVLGELDRPIWVASAALVAIAICLVVSWPGSTERRGANAPAGPQTPITSGRPRPFASHTPR
jgi:hypothetical protein